MRGYIANTDFEWYFFLKRRENLEEVNFWQPSGSRGFQAISPGEPFFFKLKNPHCAIAGFGHFVRHSILPAWLAWQAFEETNGAPDLPTMCRRIEKYRRSTGTRLDPNYKIGCLMVSQPVFFEEAQWVPQPIDWARNVVQGKTYDLTTGEGRRIFEQCQVIASLKEVYANHGEAGEVVRYGEPILVQPRLGQGSFRISVIEAYHRACAVTGEHSLPALEAAHIKPFSSGGEHRVSNGLLLRSDIHRLFDQGYVTVTPEYRFEVSRRLREDFESGRSYYPLNGQLIQIPSEHTERPSRDVLDWHNREAYLS